MIVQNAKRKTAFSHSIASQPTPSDEGKPNGRRLRQIVAELTTIQLRKTVCEYTTKIKYIKLKEDISS